MKRIVQLFVAIAFFSKLSLAHAFGVECKNPKEGSTLAESCILQQQLVEAEEELNAIYNKLIIQWKPKHFAYERTALVASQRAWLTYRDKTCSFEQAVHGGIVSISFSRCAVRVTVERVSYLKGLL